MGTTTETIGEAALVAWDGIVAFRGIINFWVVGIPWTILGIAGLIYNIFLNLDFNKFWGGFNFMLVWCTLHGFFHFLHSVVLVFEIDFLLKITKFVRLLFLWDSIVFLFFFFGSAIYFIWTYEDWEPLFFKDDYQPDLATMIEVMVIAYNLFMHWPFAIIDIVIIVKEIFLEFITLWEYNNGFQRPDLSLGFHDIFLLLDALMELFNPFWWFSKDPWIYE
uniref:Uncharacterized protein n=1 Tax=Strombidium inclinatum TaxID=197538 RepID=A0A7S3MZN3_9SPIT|mmetsp:Transcript_32908/g.50318  ORF Transcript_32908/g.50318 Transcript_32908/m.50318 type:complete len:220 (+) Transcript_32908:59-718(+)|eukprot:CAMPEP_0170493576 /NCGR_PEP_ID=MMETSP0208-20121228/14119_1 /TAXON_ID=197538 /ORGANISM="Strombidium inclinatum, Strain S3" /LENGTH=219 /DNA_ID=CAMNT_0010769523 /DNA_START=35 /DNA_END=694 /DNA_ORIENTATION=+